MNLIELGKYKQKVLSEIRKDNDIKHLLLGDDYDVELEDDLLDECVYSHLFVDETETETKSFIGVDVTVPRVRSFAMEDVNIIVNVFCHKDIIKYSKTGYVGNRVDILSQMIDKKLNGLSKFGIGKLQLKEVGLYKPINTYYGRTLLYTTTEFNNIGGDTH